MKKYFLAVILMAFVGSAWGANSITKFVLSNPTTTTITASWIPSGITATIADSLTVIRSDSTYGLVLSSMTATTGKITGLAPHTQYIYYVRAHLKAGGYICSNLDTLFTAWPDVEDGAKVVASTMMRGARSWPASARYDSLYVGTADGIDSTMVYNLDQYTGFQVKAIGDSSKVLFRVFTGHAEKTQPARETTQIQTGVWGFKNVAIDSLNVTAQGWTLVKSLAAGLPGDHFYIQADGQTGNGQATKAIIRLYRKHYGR